MHRMRKLSTFPLLLRLMLAAIFIYASIDKIRYPAEFAAIVTNYRVLPDSLINLTAIVLPWLELVLGVLLVLGRWRGGTLLLVNLLLLIFWTVLVFNYFRGIDISCGCFSTKFDESSSMVWYLVRDGFFLCLALCAGAFHVRARKVAG